MDLHFWGERNQLRYPLSEGMDIHSHNCYNIREKALLGRSLEIPAYYSPTYPLTISSLLDDIGAAKEDLKNG